MAVPGASLQEKAAAIRTLEIEPQPTLTGLGDCDLAIALWQRMEDVPFRDEVRAAAAAAFAGEKALAKDSSECTAFIRTGIHEAKTRDVQIERRTKAEQRAERQLKQQAAQTIGLVADAAMLALTIKEFVWTIRMRATGPKVKAAAEAAYNGTDAQRQTFLGAGIAVAHEADRRQQIEDEAAGDLAKQKRLLEEAARKRALALLLTTATPAMLESTDRDFITYIWEHATPGSQIRATAEKVVLSRDPAVWNAYIHTGMREAHDRDIQIALDKKYEDDRAQAEALIARATEDKDVNLANATRRALAGTRTELDDFLREGQYDLDLFTGFEAGDVQLDSEDTPAWDGSIHNVIYCEEKVWDWRAYCGSLGRMDGGFWVTKHTGRSSIRYVGMDQDTTQSFAYFRGMHVNRVVIKATTTLSYWIYPESSATDGGEQAHNSTCVAVDLTFSDGSVLRNSGATD
ncbi:MAG TPA: ALF repeat-containing protein, partial [Catenuloplanes sp.]